MNRLRGFKMRFVSFGTKLMSACHLHSPQRNVAKVSWGFESLQAGRLEVLLWVEKRIKWGRLLHRLVGLESPSPQSLDLREFVARSSSVLTRIHLNLPLPLRNRL